MVMRIHKLSPAVANQIAAGEVIERPASVVKELLENAYDAHASQVTVELFYGGLNQIRISDDGDGIIEEDLALAIAAHATSKIQRLDDLYSLHSMGFRGEALASIASVSHITITSKPSMQTHAAALMMEDGVIQIRPAARSKGTTIGVCDLFYNVPVRKRFLKSERIEFQAVEQVVKRFALSAPHIAVTLKHNGQNVLSLPAAKNEATLATRLKRLFGSAFLKDAIQIDAEGGGMRLHGWVSGLSIQRSQNDRQWVYLNQRMVKDKLLQHAIKQVYEGLLYPGRFPVCLLYLTMEPSEVDVNVHPTKHEVRFQQPRLVHDFITSQLTAALKTTTTATVAAVSEYVVDESYKPAIKIAEPQPQQFHHNWFMLNEHFVILNKSGRSYLLDVVASYQDYLQREVKQKTVPWAKRPILVPITISVSTELFNNAQQLSELLSSFGMDIVTLDEGRFLLKSQPTCLPYIDLQRFFKILDSEQTLTFDCIRDALLLAQGVDAFSLSADERAMLTHEFMQGQLNPKCWCELNSNNLRSLFDAS